jgi:hypothetical protein
MSRILVPRGEPPFPVFQLSDTSPFWERLTPDEQDIARQTVEDRPVMFLSVALCVMTECLSDFRRARDEDELVFLFERLRRVVRRVRDGATDDTFRSRYTVPTRVRLMLLGAERADAIRLSEGAIAAVLDLIRDGSVQPSPHIIRYAGTQHFDPNAAQQRWDENARWLAACNAMQSDLGDYRNHELRAFPEDPPPDLLFIARGPRYEHAHSKASVVPDLPESFTIAAIEKATRHARTLLGYARLLVDKATRQPTDASWETANELGRYAIDHWEELDQELHASGCLAALRDPLHLLREENYVIGDVIEPSIHEAIRELARRVWMAFRSGVCATHDRTEGERWFHGPWEGHEVVAAFAWFREHARELVAALDSTKFQTLEADLKRESAKLKRLAPQPSAETQNAKDSSETQAMPAKENDDSEGAKKTGKRPKPSTQRGDGRVKLIAALTKHHQYANGGSLNLEPINNNELARQANVDKSTASDFFKQQFGDHGKYKTLCRNASRLTASLKLLNDEFTPHTLFGKAPPGEDDRDASE